MGGVPPINTRSIETDVVLADGQTVVLGGILERSEGRAKSHVPGLSQLPLLGKLFDTASESNTKQELLIFVTPREV